MADIVRLHGEDALPARPAPNGYAPLSRRIMRRTDLRTAKLVLQGLISYCWADKRETRATIKQVSLATGLPLRTVQYHFTKLRELGLIDRRPDPDSPGGPWVTRILTDPKGFELDDTPVANWRLIHPPTPRNPLRDPTQPIARPHATHCAGSSFIQNTLSLSAEVSDSAPPPGKTPEPPRSPDPYRGPRDPGRAPEGYRWVYGQGNPREGARPALVPIPGHGYAPPADDPDEAKLRAAIAEIRALIGPAGAAKKPAAGASGKSPAAGPSPPSLPGPPVSEHTVKACTRQEANREAKRGHRAPPESNRPSSGPEPPD